MQRQDGASPSCWAAGTGGPLSVLLVVGGWPGWVGWDSDVQAGPCLSRDTRADRLLQPHLRCPGLPPAGPANSAQHGREGRRCPRAARAISVSRPGLGTTLLSKMTAHAHHHTGERPGWAHQGLEGRKARGERWGYAGLAVLAHAPRSLGAGKCPPPQTHCAGRQQGHPEPRSYSRRTPCAPRGSLSTHTRVSTPSHAPTRLHSHHHTHRGTRTLTHSPTCSLRTARTLTAHSSPGAPCAQPGSSLGGSLDSPAKRPPRWPRKAGEILPVRPAQSPRAPAWPPLQLS